MGCLGNLIWFIFSGLWQGLGWTLAGVLWCITIIGIPIGLQCFKIAGFVFLPFGKEVTYGEMGVISAVANVFWIILSGIPLALAAILNGLILCITIIWIPFGLQCFKFAKLALMPFGAKVY
ncbi:YccF domain-containing protein [Miniphocaeibacter massiliensis]|uniref:YccF domain-containing protein n=1 Tax=Miniphocaeibacter massiliensis TaxID=2041841 RepID=UPI000C06C71D|nr:YccF domain-containing protein [Miniphocaeibacter massiliensis]